ncbi:MAG TPA: gas vesicle protein [Micromonosporaceae bacterium]|jgi:hypothetical protein
MAGQRHASKARNRYPDDVDAREDTRTRDVDDARYDDDRDDDDARYDDVRDDDDARDDDAEYDDAEYDADSDAEDDDRSTASKPRRPSPPPGMSAREAAQAALEQISDLTNKSPLGVTAVRPSDDGWAVGVEVLEDHRIPSSVDVLGTYEVDLDARGALMSYRRIRTYQRGRGDTGGDAP